MWYQVMESLFRTISCFFELIKALGVKKFILTDERNFQILFNF